MKCSIVMATKNKAPYLKRTLDSIFRQLVNFEYEVIVVDDGSTDNTRKVCQRPGVQYIRLENPRYRNPALARNVGYRAATGEVIIAQSDEVIHHTSNAINQLCANLRQGEFLLATVYNYFQKQQKRGPIYTGNKRQRPFFFLGSLWRKDLYAIGGNDEEFVEPGYDDNWFADCLMHGLKLKPRYLDAVIGHHQDHPRPSDIGKMVKISHALYTRKARSGKYENSGGPWPWWEGETIED